MMNKYYEINGKVIEVNENCGIVDYPLEVHIDY